MYDAGKIVIGLLVFVAVATFPFWYPAASGDIANGPPVLVYPEGSTKCVESTQYMRDAHMGLLDEWRDRVVRDGERIYTAEDGTEYEMSLTNTCLGCHTDKKNFCDECHTYLAVTPFCWDCHVVPGEDYHGE